MSTLADEILSATGDTVRGQLRRIGPLRRAVHQTRRLPFYARDVKAMFRYGPHAPRYAERLWVTPNEVLSNPFPKVAGYLKSDSGRVVSGQWPAISDTPEARDIGIHECLQRWSAGQTWEETGRIDRWLEILRTEGEVYGCHDLDEIRERLARWDQIFDAVATEGRLRTRAELREGAFREVDGIGMHVGPSGRIYKGRGGHHRFAMALALSLRVIPAQIGVVHVTAIPHLDDLRRGPSSGPDR